MSTITMLEFSKKYNIKIEKKHLNLTLNEWLKLADSSEVSEALKKLKKS